MLKKKFLRCQSAAGRFGYSNQLILSNPILESTISTISPHVVRTTGPGISQEGIIPIASLFSSMDLVQPSTIMKKSPSPHIPLRRAKTSFHQTEQDNEQIIT
jgi:hypothetical protein